MRDLTGDQLRARGGGTLAESGLGKHLEYTFEAYDRSMANPLFRQLVVVLRLPAGRFYRNVRDLLIFGRAAFPEPPDA